MNSDMMNMRGFVWPDHTVIADKFDLYDLHVHTTYSDGLSSPKDVMRRARELGIGVAITDHNEIRGSIVCGEHSGGVRTIPGIELATCVGVDLLAYFTRMDDLERFYVKEIEGHKSIDPSSFTDLTPSYLIDAVKEHGGLSYLAHPFGYLWKNWTTILNSLHEKTRNAINGIEGMNGALSGKRNKLALELAKHMNKPVIGGSDAHLSQRIGECLTMIPTCNHGAEAFMYLYSGSSVCLSRPDVKARLSGIIEPLCICGMHMRYWPRIIKEKIARGFREQREPA